jgi:pimeloyl-ACP methyl ester carboxylesterase
MTAARAPKPACVFVHGYVDGPAVWRRLIDRLDIDAASSTCVRLAPVGDPQRTSAQLLEAYAQQVQVECAAVPGQSPIVLVGHSMGGPVVELAASLGVERLAGLVLVTPAPLGGVPLPSEVMDRFTARTALTDRADIRSGKRALAVDLDEAAQEILAQATLDTGAAFALEQLKAWTGGHPDGRAPSRVEVPVQIVTTDDRFFTVELLEREAARYRDAEVRKVAGAGHWPQLEQPELLAIRMNRFFDRISAAAVDGSRE